MNSVIHWFIDALIRWLIDSFMGLHLIPKTFIWRTLGGNFVGPRHPFWRLGAPLGHERGRLEVRCNFVFVFLILGADEAQFGTI